MKRTRTTYHLFRELQILDEMAKYATTDDKRKQYAKMQDVFFNHVKQTQNRR